MKKPKSKQSPQNGSLLALTPKTRKRVQRVAKVMGRNPEDVMRDIAEKGLGGRHTAEPAAKEAELPKPAEPVEMLVSLECIGALFIDGNDEVFLEYPGMANEDTYYKISLEESVNWLADAYRFAWRFQTEPLQVSETIMSRWLTLIEEKFCPPEIEIELEPRVEKLIEAVQKASGWSRSRVINEGLQAYFRRKKIPLRQTA